MSVRGDHSVTLFYSLSVRGELAVLCLKRFIFVLCFKTFYVLCNPEFKGQGRGPSLGRECLKLCWSLKSTIQRWLVDPYTIIFPENTAQDVFKTMQILFGQRPRQRCRAPEVEQKHGILVSRPISDLGSRELYHEQGFGPQNRVFR